jgi:hypothetical protein
VPEPLVLFPDAEAVAVTLLSSALDPSVTVDTEWPENLAENLPVVAVSRGGGGEGIRYVRDDPRMDIDVLAATKAEAHDLAQLVRAHLTAARGTTQPGARIYDVGFTSMIWLPDPVTNIPRYVLVMDWELRPA